MPAENRVLVVFPGKQDSGTGWGGVFNATISHIQALKAAGAEVVVWTASKPIADAAEQAGAEVDYDPIWHRGIDPLFALRCWRKAKALKRRSLLGALHEGGRTGLWGRILLWGIPQAGVMHRERLSSYRTFRDLLVLSDGYKRQLIESGQARGRSIAVAPNALKSESFQPQQLPTPEQNPKPIIGFVGRIEQVKGIDLLIESAAQLKAQGLDFKMDIAGGAPGGYLGSVKTKGLEDTIHFSGWHDSPEQLYPQWDIFCLPSRNEPFGLSLIEAMSAGLPAVATQCHGPSDIIEDGVSGFLTPIEDVSQLTEKLALLIKSPQLRYKIGHAASERIRNNYCLPAVGKRIIQALLELGKSSAHTDIDKARES